MGEREVPGPAGTRFPAIRWFDVIDSTNRYALEAASEGAPDGLVIAADHQSQGRGRRGRVWDSRPGASLLFSVLFRNDPSVQPSVYARAVGLAVVDALATTTGVEAGLKWPNDVLVGSRKLAGILAEATSSGGVTDVVVVGCGMNLNWRGEMPLALRESAVSLDEVTGRPVAAAPLLDAVLAAFDARLRRPAWVPASYRSRCATIGQMVRVERPGGDLAGRATDVTDAGELVVETTDGPEVVSVGDAVHLRPV